MDAVTPMAIGTSSLITPITVFVYKHVDRILEEVHSGKTLEEQLLKQG